MTRLMATVVGAVVLAGAGMAFAESDYPAGKKMPAPKAEKAKPEKMNMEALQHEVLGEVVKVEANTLYIRHMGAVVPFELKADTKWSNLQRQDLKEGREIRASFTVEGQTQNVLKEIMAAPMHEMMPTEALPKPAMPKKWE